MKIAGRLAVVSLVVGVVAAFTGGASAQSTEFTEAGTYEHVVPDGVCSVSVSVLGASGGDALSFDEDPDPTNIQGGSGAHVSGRLAVTPGEVLTVRVGGMGGLGQFLTALPGTGTGAGGFNGGGDGGDPQLEADIGGGGGGGASDVSRGGVRLVVAAGGGGAGGDNVTGGGAGGDASGGGGQDSSGGEGGGDGATATSPGTGGSPAGSGEPGEDGDVDGVGTGGDGGASAAAEPFGGGGGGGGGVHGGGGGAGGSATAVGGGGGGGGAGASFAAAEVTETRFTDDANPEGDGTVLIEPTPGVSCVVAVIRFTG